MPVTRFPALLAVLILLSPRAELAAEPDGRFHPLLPGFTAEPLPVDLPNCNNVLYRHDGKLVVFGYAGDVYLLSDRDGDGAEETVQVFWENNGRVSGQIGMDLAPEGSPHGNAVFLAVKGKIIMLADRDGDDRAETMTTLAEGWPPARAGVDVTGLAVDPRDGAVWFGLGVRLYNDAYELEETGVAGNDLSGERGAIHRIAPDFGSREKICTGIRWPIALRFNRLGDLFATDQEGATWLPNGNPFDELLHIQAGRHYGFPPRHPKHLPNVIDEPSVYDFGPQHQSTCGMAFNEPVNGGPVFGPDWWRGDALIAGESRGKIYRTKLVKTAAGYVAHHEIIACLGMLTIDLCVSPTGELRVATHSGPPDWGTGPTGRGQLWRVRYEPGDEAPQPVIAWRHAADEVRVAFDRPLSEDWSPDDARVEASPNARAGDRFETMRPPYEVVRRQVAEGREPVATRLGGPVGNRSDQIFLRTDAVPERTWLGIELPGGYALQTDSSGVAAEWHGADGSEWNGWLPHLDLQVADELTAASAGHRDLLRLTKAGAGSLTLKTRLDLWHMLRPAIQLGASLDYEYPPEEVTVRFESRTGPFEIEIGTGTAAGESRVSRSKAAGADGAQVAVLTVTPVEGQWLPLTLTLDHPGRETPDLTLAWSTAEDSRSRPFPIRRFVMPWAQPAEPTGRNIPVRPEIQGGNWARGRELFFGEKALCATCHRSEGQGTHIGPDLAQLPFRDYGSVLRDIREPSAAINPDYPSHEIELVSGAKIVAVPIDQPDGTVRLGIGPGAVMAVKKAEIQASRPLATSLMPAGLDQALTADELRDLMTYLLHERPVMRDYPTLPRDGVGHAPAARERAEIERIRAATPPRPDAEPGPIRVVLVAGKKDHGFGEHDYPRWQHVWSRLLSIGKAVDVSTAWEWPSNLDWQTADALVFYKRGNWTRERAGQLRGFLERGGGAVFIHWACEAGEDADTLASVIGLASNSRLTRYRHGIIDLSFNAPVSHPITRGFDRISFHDESYWNLVGTTATIQSLATAVEDGAAHPLFWVREFPGPDGKRPGRVFVSIPGHYSWTFDDPAFRILLLRGIAWTAGEPVDRFDNLIEAGIEMR